jgi:F-type H+/Na+-transporting ATPase subunit alpha
MKNVDQYIKELELELSKRDTKVVSQEVGILTQVKDGVAILTGLYGGFFGELIEFENGVQGFIIDLTEDNVGVVVLGDYLTLKAGTQARATGKILSLPVGDGLLGRVIDPLATILDGGEKVKLDKRYPIERIAPGVVYRKPVSVPLQTGIKSIDALIPIGRGQRELIIGDRSTGKTTVAIDTIINQKNENVICIYCAVGQKTSKVAGVIETLRQHDALKYTVIVSATASDPAAMQYIAPYSATALGEYFMDQGKDVLVIYDDLSKHAWSYRQISLILRRPAGREAYPGDIFYLHSRLLERACRIDEKHGGGSLTALPIIETLEGDIAGYIPTNIISITDGQIFLETELFNSGIRPAVNVGTSVSRVGGSAQTKAMKQVAGTLKLDLAQYRSLAAFSQFESDLDAETKKFLNRGAKTTQVLKQKKHVTYSLAQEVAILWAAAKGHLDALELDQIEAFEDRFIQDLRLKGEKLMNKINENKIIDKADEAELEKFVKQNLP